MILSWNYSTKRYALNTVSTPIILHSWLNHHYNQIWINLHFFASKVHFLRLFGAKIQKNFNKPPPKKPQIFINRRRTIGADTVFSPFLAMQCVVRDDCQTFYDHLVTNVQHMTVCKVLLFDFWICIPDSPLMMPKKNPFDSWDRTN